MDEEFLQFESKVFELLEGKLSSINDEGELLRNIETISKTVNPAVTQDEINQAIADARKFDPIDDYLHNEEIEDIMVNNTRNIFVYRTGAGIEMVKERIPTRKELSRFVKKLRMYATSDMASKQIFDVHMPTGARANIVESPLGADVTIRSFKKKAYSIIDLINRGELSYNMAGRLWVYSEGLKVRPANIVIGGTPGSGKTTLLNAMFSFFRPEERIVVIEETYELNTETQENCVRLETSPQVDLQDLLKNSLRMRPDMLIVGEVRGAEAQDMMVAMNIGKIAMSTIHASTTRDIITRLESSPMNIDRNAISLVDVLMVVSQVQEEGMYTRKITQVSEVSGVETKVLLSDLFLYDYKTRKGSQILPSVTYRDNLSKLSGYSPSKIIEEEQRRAKILEKLNKMGIRDLAGINNFCKEYYEDPEKALNKIELSNLGILTYD
ncbi:MAG: CpaF family protein [Candidatus Micrarchaeota archaeon]|nr:CpaF family protein [Candidatus Micrarchaeota archaeon]MDE1849316.1 CpaF family protein [Candidatus Micrarchaeota archaeon]